MPAGEDKRRFTRYKWVTLLTFSLMYNFAYVGRFNIVDHLSDFSDAVTVGSTQQDLIYFCLFLSYGIGSFCNGMLCRRLGGKRLVILGASISIFANMFTVLAVNWETVFVLQIVNGYFQSMIWVGGIAILADWWEPRECGIGVGIANFFSGLSHVTAFLLPQIILLVMSRLSWQSEIVLPMYVWGLFLILFIMFSAESPQQCGLPPYALSARESVYERRLQRSADRPGGVFGFLCRHRKLMVWCLIALMSSMCRYGLLSWIPSYFQGRGEQVIISETFSNLMFPLGMAMGTLFITWLTGTRFRHNIGLMIVWTAALCGSLVIVVPMVGISRAVLMSIFFSGFFLYGINGILWLYAIRAGARHYAGWAAGLLNGFAYLGAALEFYITPMMIRRTGSVLSVFYLIELLCIGMILCGIMVSRKDTVVEPEARG
ncbi:MAG: MFS transporter [Anaerovoracaceae bacterium]|jgi:sugar phosphate permease